MSKFTPGPWNEERGGSVIRIVEDKVLGGDAIAVIASRGSSHARRADANACLICAAPELYISLFEAVRLLRAWDTVNQEYVDRIALALRKAEGK